ncbi:MAG TPA: DUF1127 domain-containing protein [Roseovarius sp.]|nr:DUF1127 domain-containing protein [Roseovarius sp.]
MARSIVTQHGAPSAVWGELRAAVGAAMQHVMAWMAYRRTVRELSDLSNRDLADLGLHRSEIRRVARDSVYGAGR